MDWFKSMSDMIDKGRYPSMSEMLKRIQSFYESGDLTFDQAETLKKKLMDRENK